MTINNEQSRLSLFKEAFKVSNTEKSVLLASTFRSGSTFVANLINQNGLSGLNLEKFNGSWKYVKASDKEFYDSCVDITSSTEAGVFASKIMWPHRNQLAMCLQIDRKHSADFVEAFPASKWIFVCREDKVKQSISFWRAKKSNRWHVTKVEEEPVLEYDYLEIRDCYNEIMAHDSLWDDFFVQASIAPFRVKYEDFQSNLETQLKSLLDYIGDHRTSSRTFTTLCELQRQSDPMSENYYDRFIEDSYRFPK